MTHRFLKFISGNLSFSSGDWNACHGGVLYNRCSVVLSQDTEMFTILLSRDNINMQGIDNFCPIHILAVTKKSLSYWMYGQQSSDQIAHLCTLVRPFTGQIRYLWTLHYLVIQQLFTEQNGLTCGLIHVFAHLISKQTAFCMT